MTTAEFEAKRAQEDALRAQLLANLKAQLPELKRLLASVEGHWGAEDTVYRFYHQSFKVYGNAQSLTNSIVAALRQLLPERELNSDFLTIVTEGTGKRFELSHNKDWLPHTRPMVEAMFHAIYFLRMACKYGEELRELPNPMASGWAAILYLYNLR